MTYSNDFSNAAWTKFGSPTLTSGQSGYDGSSDAWLYESTTASHSMLQFVSGSGVYSFSVYAKAGTADGIRLRVDDATGSNIYVDLTDGSIITDQSGITYNIESVGSGWYRVSITSNVSSLSNVRLIVVNNVGASTTGTIYIQDAQVEIGLAATDYIESGASTGKAGLLEDEPRFDYSGGATCPSLLLEPSRTQLIGQTEYFESWPNTEVSLMPNHGSSPEGLNNAYSMSETTATNRHRIFLSLGKAASAIDYCFSVFVKNKSGSRNIRLNLESSIGGNKASVVFDTSGNVVLAASTSGSFANAESFKEQVGDYWKYTLKATSDTSTTLIPIILLNDGTTEVYTGDGTSGVYLFGAQLEAGSYPTSYIPNHSGGTITRGGENCSKTGISDLIGQTEGTIFIETFSNNAQDGTTRIQLSSGTSTSDWIFLSCPEQSGSEFKPRVFINNGGSNQVNSYGSSLSSGNHKYALAYKENDVVLYVDGVLQISDTSASIPTCDKLTICGLFPTSNNTANKLSKHNQALLFNTRLSNADLATLTTL